MTVIKARKCPKCLGSGRTKTGSRCKKCNGSGEIVVPNPGSRTQGFGPGFSGHNYPIASPRNPD